MDFGNAQTTGEVMVGNIRSKISQPASSEYLPMPRMNVITEEVSYSTIREEDSGPSCSLAEALRKQDLFINSMLAQIGCDILWRMFREGRTFYRGGLSQPWHATGKSHSGINGRGFIPGHSCRTVRPFIRTALATPFSVMTSSYRSNLS